MIDIDTERNPPNQIQSKRKKENTDPPTKQIHKKKKEKQTKQKQMSFVVSQLIK